MKNIDFQLSSEAKKKKRRIGRGHGSGWGKTSGKGHKGQKARSGGRIRWGFEGGQLPLQRRLPKRGFNNKFALKVVAVTLGSLEVFDENSVVDISGLCKVGLVKRRFDKIKIISGGELKKKLNVRVNSFSSTARQTIVSLGGTAEVM
ncbi:MAG: 50S ribosomal protein L15 [Candidatus Improbicoccus pseudotrichonymphae]|uniref:Large ribosomal subunit protein uL15 n=1 Tax=Candidatus Improbicoccus pseudotrichonymphae TaxID=3033792 RepID=A0AA48HXQ2_9FIRM|nr:MAG: 50S ribosomal protein L15 [Candidatus Improbicoccus pseudotrichonymphae]